MTPVLRFLAVLAAAIGSGTPAQDGPNEDVTFDYYRGTTLIGRERVTIRDRGGAAGVIVTSDAAFPPARPVTYAATALEFGPDFRLQSAQVAVRGGDERSTLVSVLEHRLTLRMITAAGEATREFPARDPVLLVDSLSVAPLMLVGRLPDEAAAGLIGPGGDRQTAPVVSGGRDGRGRRVIRLGEGSLERVIVTDDAGRIWQVEFPRAGVTVRRAGAEP